MEQETKQGPPKAAPNVDPSGVQLFRKPVGEVEIDLPCGLLIDGEVYKKAVITPLTGRDRKAMVDQKSRSNPSKVVTKLLTNRLLSLGPYKHPVADVRIKALLSGDREYIVYKLYEITDPTRKDLEATLQCQNRACGSNFEFNVPFDEVKVIRMTDADQERIHDGKKTRYWEFEDEEWAVKAKFRYVDGKIQEQVSPRLASNPVEGEYMLFSKMILEWNGLTSLTMDQIETLPEPLIRKVEKALADHKLGPDMDLNIVCPECGVATRGGLDFTTFLFR